MPTRPLLAVLLTGIAWLPAAGAADIDQGRGIYQRYCLMCHGADGRGSMAGAPDFSRGQGLLQSDRALAARIARGKNACPAYRGILDERDTLDVIAYIRTLL